MSAHPATLACIFALLMSSASAWHLHAGDYHDRATLHCTECHTMHASADAAAANAGGDGGFASTWPGAGSPDRATPGTMLLKDDINDLCLSCHDNSTQAADVLGWNQGRGAGDVRQAGFLNRLGIDGEPATGHTLDARDVAPGSNPPWKPEEENGAGGGLNCINCHSPHGRQGTTSAYRNLRSDAGHNDLDAGLLTYNDDRPGSNDLTRDVFLRRTLDYDESAVDFNEPESTDSALARFCAGCHSLFHGVPGADEQIGGTSQGSSFTQFLRHPTGGVNLGAVGGTWSSSDVLASHGNRIKVMSELGAWDPPGQDATPTCISCHKAHGNGNAFGLIYRSGVGTLTEDGDSGGDSLRHLCGQCHSQGSAFSTSF